MKDTLRFIASSAAIFSAALTFHAASPASAQEEAIPTASPVPFESDTETEDDADASTASASAQSSSSTPETTETKRAPKSDPLPVWRNSPSGIKYQIVKEGTGPKPRKLGPGDIPQKAVVHYAGTLPDGTEFDKSRPGPPFKFFIGMGQVIKGWDMIIADMRVGEIRKVIIPPGLAYGSQGAPPKIPSNATLHFTMELMELEEVQP